MTDFNERTFTTISAGDLSRLRKMQPATATAPGAPTFENVHVSDKGDRIYSLASIDVSGKGTVKIEGGIGFLEVAAMLSIETDGKTIKVTIEVTKPISFGPETWEFSISGDTLALSAAPKTEAMVTASFNPLCIIQCAGTAILPTLIACLPSLAGGPQAYVACVIAKVGTADAAKIALCVATKCL